MIYEKRKKQAKAKHVMRKVEQRGVSSNEKVNKNQMLASIIVCYLS